MTTRTLTRLLAGGAACLALAISATPAAAGPNTDTKHAPTDKNGKRSCPTRALDGSVLWMPNGTEVTFNFPDGTSATRRCEDGTWVNARPLAAAGIRVPGNDAFVDASGVLVFTVPVAIAAAAPVGAIQPTP
jgi:hypothetical protein